MTRDRLINIFLPVVFIVATVALGDIRSSVAFAIGFLAGGTWLRGRVQAQTGWDPLGPRGGP